MKSLILKKLFFKMILFCPSNGLRVFIYRTFFNYKIGSNTKIGKSVINAQNVQIGDNVTIRNKTSITCNSLRIGNGSAIHSGNVIMGKADFSIGENSRLINDHYVDVWNTVSIGNNSWLAGKRSQLWTHGSLYTKTGTKDLSITIGDNVYIGSSSLIAPGVTIASVNLIGLGSVVVTSFETTNAIIAGNPAQIIKSDVDWRENW
jgi:acetyltransferase-like isoleucine patch superfamily enzyme